MEEQLKTNDVKKESSLGIQDYLSIGYVFLLVLGVFYQTIYFKYLGVNILEYSSILDVLISPIAVLTGDLKLLVGVVVCCVLALVYAKYLPKYYDWLSKKKKYQSGKKKEKLDKVRQSLKNGSKALIMFLIALYIMGGFIGFGIGRGQRTQERINDDDYKLTHQITFEDGQVSQVKMLGKNSLYIFYINKGDKEVSIAPIDSNIKLIKKLKKETKD
ncbi:hypothetical protein [Olleya aquimaris]|uniref:Uncharacterized protein n=1 Tax=Olleya aquimaris TaxID=639310 RepID=A0A327RI29_9FLAO|nr:hypothetical protein [Olleya aquimaris]RAJ16271.1 hypothetical protein LY08_01129 [Olleya aquimaris]